MKDKFGCSDCGGNTTKEGDRCPWCWRGFPGQPERTSPKPERVTIPAHGVGESVTLKAPAGLHSRIVALSAFTQYGPDYSRFVTDTLFDMSRAFELGFTDSARAALESAESRAFKVSA